MNKAERQKKIDLAICGLRKKMQPGGTAYSDFDEAWRRGFDSGYAELGEKLVDTLEDVRCFFAPAGIDNMVIDNAFAAEALDLILDIFAKEAE